ncbi:condensation domain-containing protein, partial [Paraburkholderia fungorum]|uniref:condensation domain-containing protein n=1 Tax=Paraburkholderia fungorum TaxID=134537 RepID=UPI0038BC1C7D
AAVAETLDAQANPASRETLAGEVPLLPIQAGFFAQHAPNRHHWNQALLLQSGEALDEPALEAALHALVAHHDALRLRFEPSTNGEWTQTYAASESAQLLWTRNASASGEIEAICDEAQQSLNLTHGPLLRAMSIRLADGTARLLLAIHHLAVDGVSWRVLLEDLQAAYEQIRSGATPALPEKTASYGAWSMRLQEYARTKAVRETRDYWQRIGETPAAIPLDHEQGDNTQASARQRTVTLDAATTRQLLKDAPSAYRTQVNDLLLVALGRALCGWTKREAIRIDVEGHGREDVFDDIDVSRTCGWFTTLFPVRLAPQGETGEAICRVKEALRAIPARGLGFGALRHFGVEEDRAALSGIAPAQVVFNYLGQFDSSFDSNASSGWQPASES